MADNRSSTSSSRRGGCVIAGICALEARSLTNPQVCTKVHSCIPHTHYYTYKARLIKCVCIYFVLTSIITHTYQSSIGLSVFQSFSHSHTSDQTHTWKISSHTSKETGVIQASEHAGAAISAPLPDPWPVHSERVCYCTCAGEHSAPFYSTYHLAIQLPTVALLLTPNTAPLLCNGELNYSFFFLSFSIFKWDSVFSTIRRFFSSGEMLRCEIKETVAACQVSCDSSFTLRSTLKMSSLHPS